MSQRAKRYIFDFALIIGWCLLLAVFRTATGIHFDDVIETFVCFGAGAVIGLIGQNVFPDEAWHD